MRIILVTRRRERELAWTPRLPEAGPRFEVDVYLIIRNVQKSKDALAKNNDWETTCVLNLVLKQVLRGLS